MKGDEVNMFRNMAITASIHTLAKERLGEQEVSHMVIENLGADSHPTKRQKTHVSFFSGR